VAWLGLDLACCNLSLLPVDINVVGLQLGVNFSEPVHTFPPLVTEGVFVHACR
jgi:hypothetical protein